MRSRHAVMENFWPWSLAVCLFATLSLPTTGALAQDPACIDYSQQPQHQATLSLAAGDAVEVVAHANAAYVRVADVGFVVVDWSDPAAPQTVTTVALSGGARALAVGAAALYAVDGDGQLQVFDLADPLVPVALGSVAGLAEASDVCVDDAFGYVVMAGGGLQVIDLSAPLAPEAGVALPLADGNRAVAVHGHWAYVVGVGTLDHDFGAFHLVDLVNPAQPMARGEYHTDGNGWGTYDRFLDVCAGPAGVYVVHDSAWYDWDADYTFQDTDLREFDVTDFAHPAPGLDLVRGRESLAAVCVGDLAVTAMRRSGPQDPYCPDCSYDDSHLAVNRCDGSYLDFPLFDLPLPAEPAGVAWADGHVLVACGEAGLVIVAAAMLDPDHPELLKPTFPQEDVVGERTALSGDRIAVSWHHEGGCSPGDESYGTLQLLSYAGGLHQLDAWAGQYWGLMESLVFVGEDHLYGDNAIFSLTGGDIVHVGMIPGGVVRRTALVNGFLVGMQSSNLQSWDVTDPEAPVALSTLSSEYLYGLDPYGGHVYLATGFAVEIVRVDGDGSLVPVGSLTPPFAPRAIACNGALLAVGGPDGELLIYLVTDAVNLTLVAELDLGAGIRDLELGDQLYAAVADFGWAVVNVTAGSTAGVIGWVNGADAVQVVADGPRLALVDECPPTVYLTAQACPTGPLAAPDPVPSPLPGAPLVQIGDAWPNPANPRISVAFTLARPAAVEAEVLNLAGRRVATLAVGSRAAGRHVLQWDGRGATGREAASGVYLVHVRADGEQATCKVLLAR